ncbi:MAG: PIN domain-containing protein [Bryobacteraceae bacterium]
MKTAIDTNAISALWSVEPLVSEISAKLADAHRAGGLIIAAPVYAELLAYRGMTEDHLDEFLSTTGIFADFHLEEEVWRVAGSRFAKHAARRRAARAGHPRRLVADFVIGAHALLRADRLLTLDTNLYKQDFPELKLITL